jgi:hypothetical protein
MNGPSRDLPAFELEHAADYCPSCRRRIYDDTYGIESAGLEDSRGQRWCIDHYLIAGGILADNVRRMTVGERLEAFEALEAAGELETTETDFVGLETESPATIGEAVEQAKREILEAIEAGQIPYTVSSFEELHSHIDANCLAGGCDEPSLALWWRADGFANIDNIVAFQDVVNSWLEAGGIADANPCISSDSIPLWDCPCRACYTLELEAGDDSTEHETYAQWKADRLAEIFEG